MALQATEQGSRPPAKAAADPDPTPRPTALGGTGCTKRNAAAGLPEDALVEILSRLPAKSLCRSKCVSRAWCDLIADRLRCRKLPHTLEGFFYGCVPNFGYEIGSDFCGCGGEGGGKDEDEDGGSQDDDEEGGSADEDDDEGGSKDQKSSQHVHGHFINLLGAYVPLVDPSFSVLRKQSGIRHLTLLDSCNGLLLFGYRPYLHFYDTPKYVVYNPASEHWVLVPSSGISSFSFEESQDEDSDGDVEETGVSTYLMFDPVASSRFQLIEFCYNPEIAVVQTYSSKTERWSNKRGERRRWRKGGEWDLHRTISSFRGMRGTTYFNNMLHLIVTPSTGPELIAAIDGKGKTCSVIRWLENNGFPVFVGQSKGLLHCISVSGNPDRNSSHVTELSSQMTELSIWVLADYDAEEWNLKHTVSFLELFGKKSCQFGTDYNVVTIHPDRNLVFFVQHWDYKLISYNMDLKEVHALCTVGFDYGIITPYFPYFSETPVLSKKH